MHHDLARAWPLDADAGGVPTESIIAHSPSIFLGGGGGAKGVCAASLRPPANRL